MFLSIKKEIDILKKITIFLGVILIVFGGLGFGFNQYLSNIYNEKIKEEKQIEKKLQKQINEYQTKIGDLLQGKDLSKIKKMENMYNIYFHSRYKTLEKVLVLELLEEILPSNAKIAKSIKIGKDTSLSLTLYTIDTTGLDTLYNKFKYYQDVLNLFEVTGFDTIELKENDKKVSEVLGKYTPYAYKTGVKLKMNYDNLIKYYSLLYKPDKNYDKIKDIFGPDIIEPTNIPDNISISDVVELHKMYEEKYVKKK